MLNGKCMYATLYVKKNHEQQVNAGVYQVPNSVWFDQVQIIDNPELGLIHLWPDRSITKSHQNSETS